MQRQVPFRTVADAARHFQLTYTYNFRVQKRNRKAAKIRPNFGCRLDSGGNAPSNPRIAGIGGYWGSIFRPFTRSIQIGPSSATIFSKKT